MNRNISILGCGWLGFPLAIHLISSGWKVKGSTTSVGKIQLLSLNGIDPYLVHLNDVANAGDSEFWNSDVLLINIPPSLKRQTAIEYLEQVQSLIQVLESSGIKQVIFISSTSVYPDQNKTITDVDEVDTNSALLQSERLFMESSSFQTTVIRFGGLIGPGRLPARFFAGKAGIPNGNAPVNLIHLDDCIGIIETVLRKRPFGGIYHAAAPSHPSRSMFYIAAAQKAGLVLPVFVDELKKWKIIDPQKLVAEFGYNYIHPDLLKCLDQL